MRYMFLTYVTRPNGKVDENLELGKKIKTRDLQRCNVILDFKQQKVVQATMNGTTIPKNWDRVVSYYFQYYPKIIERLFEENGHPISIKVDPENPDAGKSG